LGIKLFLLTLMMIIISACNTAEQKSQVEKSSSNSSIDNTNQAIKFDQTLYFSQASSSITESATTVSFLLSRKGMDIIENQEVYIKISGDVDSNDFSTISAGGIDQTLSDNIFVASFNGAAKSLLLKIDILNDTTYELNENLHFNIISNSDYQAHGNSKHTIIINNDDTTPMANFSSSTITQAENTSAVVTVTLSNSSYKEIFIPFYVDQQLGTAATNDYTLPSSSISFLPTDGLSKTITIPITNDSINEQDENFILKMGAPFNAIAGSTNEVDITITGSGSIATYKFINATDNFDENASKIVSLELTGDIDTEISIPYTIATTSGNPINGSDYRASSLYFTFPAGSETGDLASITLDGIDDFVYEGVEEFTITVANSTHANVATTPTTTITINDTGESLPVVSLQSANYTTTEGITFYLPISLTYISATDTEITYTTAGSATVLTDHSLATTGTITIPAGKKNYQLPIFIHSDNLIDNNETLSISLDSITGATATIDAGNNVTTIILKENGSLPTVEFTTLTNSATEGSSLSVSLELDKASQDPQNITLILEDFTTSAADYNDLDATADANCSFDPATKVVTINTGATSCTMTMLFVAEVDLLDEPNEQFKFKIQQPNNLILGSKFEQIVNIVDGDSPSKAFISFDTNVPGANPALDNVTENNTSKLVYINLDKPSGFDMTVNYSIGGTATKDYDFTISSESVQIAKGDSFATITINSINDSIYEKIDEEVDIALQPGASYEVHSANSVKLTINEFSTKPMVSIRGVNSVTVNENDIVNVVFELEHPTVEDVVVNFDYYDTNNSPGTCTTATFKCADVIEDIQDLPSEIADKKVTILKGEKIAVLSFKVEADTLFELDKNDMFRILISSLDSTDYATIHSTSSETYVDININDIDLPPSARFIGNATKTINEGAQTLNIPVLLSNASDSDATYKIQVLQSTTDGVTKADINDFKDVGSNIDAAEAWDTDTNIYGNLETAPAPTLYAGSATDASSAFSAVDHSATANVIYEGVFKISSGKTQKDLTIEINNDSLYEGSEQFIVKILPDDLTPPIYPFTVNEIHNTKTINIIENSDLPSVTLVNLPADTAEGSLATIEEIQDADDETKVRALYDLDSETTNLVWEFKISNTYQHQAMSLDLQLGGNLDYKDDIKTNAEYMIGDYIVDPSASGLGQITAVQTGNSINYSIPAGSGDFDDFLKIRIMKDHRFEDDETVSLSFANLVNILPGNIITDEVLVTDDDIKPFLYISPMTSPISVNEYDTDNKLSLYIADANEVFIGNEITSKTIPIKIDLDSNFRQTATVSNTTSSINLETSNSFGYDIQVTPTQVGDYRKYKTINLTIDPLDDDLVGLVTTAPSYDAGSTSYKPYYELNVPKLQVFVSRGGDPDVSGVEHHYKGHSCTVFRGHATCFGQNDEGQLGRGDNTDFGGDPTEDISSFSSVIDLGQDQFFNPIYVLKMALGEKHTCALLSDNTVKCFGDNTYGQLGVENTTSLYQALSAIDLGTTDQIVDIKAMRNTTCVQFAVDGIKCFGKNDMAQAGTETNTQLDIGDATSEMGTNLIAVKVPTDKIEKFEVGANHACVLTTDDHLYCWGDNYYGQLGRNSDDTFIGDNPGEVAVDVVTLEINNIEDITLGQNHTCARYNYATGTNVRCWGANAQGQLGLGRVNPAGAQSGGQYDLLNIDDWNESNRTDHLGVGQYQFGQEMSSDGTKGGTCDEPIQIPFSADETCVFGGFTYDNSILVDTSVDTFNQFVQVKLKAQKLIAGNNYTCGVYDKYLFNDTEVTQKNIRCWGSNLNYHGTVWTDLGILNNIGTTQNFSSTFPGTANALIPSTASCGGVYDKDVFKKQLITIGDQAINEHGSLNSVDDWVQDYYDDLGVDGGCNHDGDATRNYHWGWISNFQNQGSPMNFELNYVYAMNNENLVNYEDIDMAGGDHHICAVLTDTDQNETTNINDRYKYMCWGANWSGQTGDDQSICKFMGGTNTTAACSNSLTKRTLDYTFN
jgi:alpha-tubulin suppressor-like RCC1 family protein